MLTLVKKTKWHMAFKKNVFEKVVEISKGENGAFVFLESIDTAKNTIIINEIVEKIMNDSIDRSKIYFFTKKLCVANSVVSSLPKKGINEIFVGSFYDYAKMFLLKNNIVNDESVFISDDDCKKLLDNIILNNKYSVCQKANEILDAIFFLKSKEITFTIFYKDRGNNFGVKNLPKCFVDIYREYEQKKKQMNVFDREDILFLVNDALTKNSDIKTNDLQYIFVDNLQHITYIECLILNKLCVGKNVLCITGNSKKIESSKDWIKSFLEKANKDFNDNNSNSSDNILQNNKSSKDIIACANSFINKQKYQNYSCSSKPPITLICSNIDTQEPYSIATSIRILLKKNKEYKLSDIGIILRDHVKIVFFINEIKKYGLKCTSFDDVDDDDSIKVFDIYNVKKMSKKCVFIANVNNNVFPASGENVDTEKERQLFYMALMSAQKEIFLSYSIVTMSSCKIQVLQKSCFIDDIGDVFINDDVQTISSLNIYENGLDVYNKVTTFDYSFLKKEAFKIKD